jgi:hypothetical protein
MAQLNNIDCLLCHQDQYKRKNVNGVFVPDTANMTISMDEAAITVHEPTRTACLQCHAKGGGGDNYKRGDMPLSLASTTDKNFDVHMATTGENMDCQKCHKEDDHRIAGRGSDLRPTDLEATVGCSTSKCHSSMRHDDSAIDSHSSKVACQTCHIRTFARNAADTPATDATEIHRDWREGQLAANGQIHPKNIMANNVKPWYRFWSGQSSVYNLGDPAMVDPEMGIYLVSKPEGSIADTNSKLYPFKYKTSYQPLATQLKILVPVDTSIFFKTGDSNAAIRSGLQNMGKNPNEPYSFVTTAEFQLITHEVQPEGQALQCTDCHGTTAQMDMKTLGYGLKGTEQQVCSSCHDDYSANSGEYSYTASYAGFTDMHKEHDRAEMDCNKCHSFSRPSTGATYPSDSTGSSTGSSSNAKNNDDDDHHDSDKSSHSSKNTSASKSSKDDEHKKSSSSAGSTSSSGSSATNSSTTSWNSTPVQYKPSQPSFLSWFASWWATRK